MVSKVIASLAYDSMDRLAMRTDPLGREEFYQYDLNGNLIQFTDRKGQVSTFVYDPLDRRTRSDFADGTFTQFTFDAAGRLIRASDSQTGTIVEEYDILDRLVRETTPQGTISYAYDPLGRRTTMTVDGQSPVAYTYDAASRLRTITQSPLSPVTIDYDALGRRTLLTLPNTVSTEYQYDPASRLTALIYRNAFGPLGDLTYEYDPAGNRIGVGGSFARTLLPDPILTSAYDAANQQVVFGNKTMIFDASGNLESLTDPTGTTTFTWDAQNRLKVVNGPGVESSFTYDASGGRTERTINGQRNTFQYDGPDIVREVSNGTEVGYLSSLIIDEPLIRLEPGESVNFVADGLGSPLALTDETGSIRSTYTYGPFGQTLVTGAASPNPFQYTGRENDATGLYYYRARYYNPILHRFISEDPIGLSGGINLYEYVGGNPINRSDPSGEFWDIVVDIGFVGYDIYRLFADGPKGLEENLIALGLDVGAAFVPFVTGAGPAFRLTRGAGKATRVTQRALAAGTTIPNAGGRIRSFVDSQDKIYYRLFSGDKTMGRYLVKTRPRSRQFALEALSLPPRNEATFIQEVLVPGGTRLQRSRALPAYGRRGGAEQFMLLDNLPGSHFGPGVPFQ